MIVYKTTFTNTDGNDFPETEAVNSTGPSTTDGTEYIAALVNDIWGARQALMNNAGLTPNDVTEAYDASQAYEALQHCFGAPGEIVPWVGNTDQPVTLGIRLIPLKGQTVAIADVPELVANTYVGDGNNGSAPAFYKTSDNPGTVRDTGGAYFVLPDLRGVFLRGKDPTGAIDPNGATREMGDIQFNDVGIHVHQIRDIAENWYTKTVLTNNAAAGTDLQVVEQTTTQTTASLQSLSPTTVSETRPTNSVCWWCIRF